MFVIGTIICAIFTIHGTIGGHLEVYYKINVQVDQIGFFRSKLKSYGLSHRLQAENDYFK